MRSLISASLAVAAGVTLLTSCSAPKKVPYLVGAENIQDEAHLTKVVISMPRAKSTI